MVRAAALITVLAGAVGSCGLMLQVGHRSNSPILLVLFTIWVAAPFIALALFAEMARKRWAVRPRALLYAVMLVLTLGSLAIYGDAAFSPPRAKPAFVFVVVPLASWLLIAVVALVGAFLSRNPADPHRL